MFTIGRVFDASRGLLSKRFIAGEFRITSDCVLSTSLQRTFDREMHVISTIPQSRTVLFPRSTQWQNSLVNARNIVEGVDLAAFLVFR